MSLIKAFEKSYEEKEKAENATCKTKEAELGRVCEGAPTSLLDYGENSSKDDPDVAAVTDDVRGDEHAGISDCSSAARKASLNERGVGASEEESENGEERRVRDEDVSSERSVVLQRPPGVYGVHEGFKISKVVGLWRNAGEKTISAVVQYSDSSFELIPTNILVDFAPKVFLHSYLWQKRI
ncbi:unnamed protein product [Toxocara canis]|uniref:Pecanex-like protein n=1 Tax=Toxocara canis TaxID=6265 RepID=A0A183UVP7_TOXCA|nr:unnamed protein product [Toxocara canis]